MTPAFLHDLETCVGCHACVVACTNENRLPPGRSWRQVVTFNPDRLPGTPVFHLSVACHHCLEAPCLRQCPARAIRRDERTGAVLIDEARCIGCRYCGWVCPYDAPVFDAGRGVMAKCTFCVDRLAGGLDPACVTACPVGALRLLRDEPPPLLPVPGFPDRGTRPAIRFLPLRARAATADASQRTAPAAVDVPLAPAAFEAALAPAAAPAPPKATFRTEWSLALFTFLAQGLVGLVLGAWLGAPGMHPAAFAALGVLGAVVSATHLGRPGRAWRAGLNWRRSWLSREVLSYGGFVTLGTLAFLPNADPRWTPVAAAAGLACLFAIDRVYGQVARRVASRPDAVAALSSGVFLGGVFAAQPLLFLPAGAVRVLAWLARERAGRAEPSRAIEAARGPVGWVLPLAAWLFAPPAAQPIAAVGALAGEWLDRVRFYDGLDVLTARQAMADALAAPRTALTHDAPKGLATTTPPA